MKRALTVILCLILLLILVFPCSAHPGRTDANGGHWNHSTGEYHYHSGTGTSGSSSNNNRPSSSTPKDWANDDADTPLKQTLDYVILVLLILLPLWFCIWPHLPARHDHTTKEDPLPPPSEQRAPTPPKKQKTTYFNPTAPVYRKTYRARRSRPRLSTKPRNALIQTNPNTSAVFDPAFFSPYKQKQFEESLKTNRLKSALSENIILKDIRQDTSTKPITVSCLTISKDGTLYNTTLTKCKCPDHENRKVICKHMILLAIKVHAITIDAPLVETSADKEAIALMEDANDSFDNDLPF